MKEITLKERRILHREIKDIITNPEEIEKQFNTTWPNDILRNHRTISLLDFFTYTRFEQYIKFLEDNNDLEIWISKLHEWQKDFPELQHGTSKEFIDKAKGLGLTEDNKRLTYVEESIKIANRYCDSILFELKFKQNLNFISFYKEQKINNIFEENVDYFRISESEIENANKDISKYYLDEKDEVSRLIIKSIGILKKEDAQLYGRGISHLESLDNKDPSKNNFVSFGRKFKFIKDVEKWVNTEEIIDKTNAVMNNGMNRYDVKDYNEGIKNSELIIKLRNFFMHSSASIFELVNNEELLLFLKSEITKLDLVSEYNNSLKEDQESIVARKHQRLHGNIELLIIKKLLIYN